jgi:S-adenosylmethionine:tRNA ribosyltransferase-isomerase
VDTAAFDYPLPVDAIAQRAIEPRDASRLLVTSTMEDRSFAELPGLLDPSDLLVVNRTRVRAARLRGTKPATGGSIELLLTRRVGADEWEALLRPARRVRPGLVLEFGPIRGRVVTAPVRGVARVELHSPDGDVDDLLPSVGSVPLPPYFRGRLDDDERYQTVFAKNVGSAAAPTAALHFTAGLLDRLTARGIAVAEVELEVGLDTFRPIAADRVTDHDMHRERYVVPAAAVDAITACRRRNGRVIAVGTTVVRTLEAAAAHGRLRAGEGETDLFIAPGYRPRVIDGLITNFHAPRSTLVVMIAALVGDRWRSIYETALARGYRFLSFGDAMFVEDLDR